MDLAGLIIAGISAMGTLIQAYYSAKDKDKSIPPGTVRAAEKRGNTPLKIGTKQVEAVIDDELLHTLSAEVYTHQQNLLRVLKDKAATQAAKERQIQAAEEEICRVLRQIKKYNDQALPTQRLKKLWTSHGC
ncbi:hypothetical protein OPS25_12575 [Alteromonas ponticola]|uniref:DUF2489 domain-containing protein n=1 Tax=Alteromonas aquimaris TaxID=2998417 RepID=A0ABT3PB75_9ALTE|nr:hypothetical protein [Alteromonas aquimaris]MCW8109336.1 hypothetical protein [Alteromonas aquimaris]